MFYVFLADGFEETEALAPVDILRRAGIHVCTVGVGGDVIRGSHNIYVTADIHIDRFEINEGIEGVILPGGMPGTKNLLADERVLDAVRYCNDNGLFVCAICAAPTVLVEAGVLEPGVHVTCYPTCQMDLDRPWSPVPVVADGNVITGQAPGSALLFGLVVLQTLAGGSAARKVARAMVTDVLEGE